MQNRIENLGRVVNQEKGIFRSRERGIFCYTLENGVTEVSSEDMESLEVNPLPTQNTQERLILDFGDSYMLL